MTIGFEDISTPGCCTHPSPGYQGFNWSGSSGSQSWVIGENADTFMISNGFNSYAGNNFAWSNGAADLELSGAAFDFNSFYARSGFGTYTAMAHGFNGATETWTQAFTVTGQYQQFSFNFLGVDKVTITNQDTNLLIDDMVVNGTAPVPEPETYAMLLAGLGLLGVAARRRKQKQSA